MSEDVTKKVENLLNEKGCFNHLRAKYISMVCDTILQISDNKYRQLKPRIKSHSSKAWEESYKLVYSILKDLNCSLTLNIIDNELKSQNIQNNNTSTNDITFNTLCDIQKTQKPIQEKIIDLYKHLFPENTTSSTYSSDENTDTQQKHNENEIQEILSNSSENKENSIPSDIISDEDIFKQKSESNSSEDSNHQVDEIVENEQNSISIDFDEENLSNNDNKDAQINDSANNTPPNNNEKNDDENNDSVKSPPTIDDKNDNNESTKSSAEINEKIDTENIDVASSKASINDKNGDKPIDKENEENPSDDFSDIDFGEINIDDIQLDGIDIDSD